MKKKTERNYIPTDHKHNKPCENRQCPKWVPGGASGHCFELLIRFMHNCKGYIPEKLFTPTVEELKQLLDEGKSYTIPHLWSASYCKKISTEYFVVWMPQRKPEKMEDARIWELADGINIWEEYTPPQEDQPYWGITDEDIEVALTRYETDGTRGDVNHLAAILKDFNFNLRMATEKIAQLENRLSRKKRKGSHNG
jgi:hypothetical protein